MEYGTNQYRQSGLPPRKNVILIDSLLAALHRDQNGKKCRLYQPVKPPEFCARRGNFIDNIFAQSLQTTTLN